MSNQALLLPVTLVAQLRPLADHGDAGAGFGRHRGDAADLRQDRLGVGLLERRRAAPPPPPPGPWRWPGRTISRLLPRLEICICTACVAPLPSVTIVITALTPITMPRIVRNERSRLRRIERSARNSVFSSIRPPALRCCGGRRAGAGCGFGASLSMRPSTKRTQRRA